MYKTIKHLVLAVFGLLLVSSCDGLLDTEDTTSVDPETAQENIEGIEAILTSVYNRTQSEFRYGRELTLSPDILSDNTEQHPITSGRGDGYAVNNQGSHLSFWNTAYLTINEANYVIEGADVIEDVPQETRDRIKGEAYFQRGFMYFDLARAYGYEPGREVNGWDQSAIIRTEPTRDVSDADLRSRSSNVDVYNQAREDLEEALDLLESDDRGVYFANYAAANALLARLHLYLENWDEAINYADEAITASGLELVDSESDFVANTFNEVPNPESIYEISIDPVEESLGSNDGLCPWTNPTHWFDIMPSQDLLDIYDPDDYRNNWFAVHTDDYPYTLKWDCSTGPFDDNIPVVRLPEMYLIMAEAHAELDQLTLALDALEEVQTARGLTAFTTADQDAIIDEVMVERRRELNFEGHRWFDLKRRGMDVTKQEGAETVPYDDFRILPDLPSDEVDNNPNLEQNPGY